MEENDILKKCDFCGKDANSLCFKCNNYFCDNCFKVIHDLRKDEKEKEKHIKETLDIFVPIELRCQKHPSNLNNLFCIDEKGKLKY